MEDVMSINGRSGTPILVPNDPNNSNNINDANKKEDNLSTKIQNKVADINNGLNNANKQAQDFLNNVDGLKETTEKVYNEGKNLSSAALEKTKQAFNGFTKKFNKATSYLEDTAETAVKNPLQTAKKIAKDTEKVGSEALKIAEVAGEDAFETAEVAGEFLAANPEIVLAAGYTEGNGLSDSTKKYITYFIISMLLVLILYMFYLIYSLHSGSKSTLTHIKDRFVFC